MGHRGHHFHHHSTTKVLQDEAVGSGSVCGVRTVVFSALTPARHSLQRHREAQAQIQAIQLPVYNPHDVSVFMVDHQSVTQQVTVRNAAVSDLSVLLTTTNPAPSASAPQVASGPGQFVPFAPVTAPYAQPEPMVVAPPQAQADGGEFQRCLTTLRACTTHTDISNCFGDILKLCTASPAAW